MKTRPRTTPPLDVGDVIPEDCTPVGNLGMHIPTGPTVLGVDGVTFRAQLLLAGRADAYRAAVAATDITVCADTIEVGFVPRISVNALPPVDPDVFLPGCESPVEVGIQLYSSHWSSIFNTNCWLFNGGNVFTVDDLPVTMTVPAAGGDISEGTVTVERGGPYGNTLSWTMTSGRNSATGSRTYRVEEDEHGRPVCVNFGIWLSGTGTNTVGDSEVTNVDCNGDEHWFGDNPLQYWIYSQSITVNVP